MDSQDLQRLKNKYDIIGNDAALNHALEMAVAVAPTDLTVLITGESGVGKEAIPQIIHQNSRRKTGKYLAVNCGAIPEGTINAELFGHEKGAFTGAVAERKGYFEEADGGTLFLDEIGELPKETQAMLLRVLQSGEFMKVGSSKVQKTDVRVIAATNINLRTAVERGNFREDLYYRLNAVQIMMPSLRERKDDIYLLFRKFSSDFSEKYNLRKISLNIEAISLLKGYRWPGNVRQLKNVSESITALLSTPVAPGSERIELSAGDIARFIPDEHDSLLPMSVPAPAAGAALNPDEKRAFVQAILDLKQEIDSLKERVGTLESNPKALPTAPIRTAPLPNDDVEWQEPVQTGNVSIRQANDALIEKALEKHGGNIREAAAELGLSERTIYRKLAKKKEKAEQ
ncbi:MAG: sigma-54-dependent Fis family transcriptional regulator [Bacteroidales bacterium]|nr:sigma-54-dependent Fis family transcriptional regulator [Bacteroidales bacterium]